MYSFTNANKNAYLAGNRQGVTLSVTSTAGATLSITEANIKQGTFVIDKMSTIGGGLPFGTAYASEMSFELSDPNGTFAAFAWKWATIVPDLYIYIGSTRTLAGRLNTFKVKSCKRKKDAVIINAMGALTELDTPFTSAGTTFTGTVADIVKTISTQIYGNNSSIAYSNVSTAATAVSMSNIQLPSGDDCTCRVVLSWAAALCGAAVIETGNSDKLALIRRSGASGGIAAHLRFYGDSDEDVAISGIKCYDGTNAEYTHVDSMMDTYNVVIQSNGIFNSAYSTNSSTTYYQALTDAVYTALHSFTMTPFSAECLSMPWLECGDDIIYTDAMGNTHTTIATHIRYVLNGKTTVECNVATAEERETNLAIAPFVERSSIEQSMIRTDALKSSNYSYTSGNFSDAGTFFNLANGTIVSENFAIDTNGNAYIRGRVEASAGNIGALTIDANGLMFDASTGDYIELTYEHLYLERNDTYIEASRSYQYGVRFTVGDTGYTMFSLNPYTHSLSLSDGGQSINMTGIWGELNGDWYLDDTPDADRDSTNTLTARIQSLESGTFVYAQKLGNANFSLVAENGNELNFACSSLINNRVQIGGAGTGRTVPQSFIFGNIGTFDNEAVGSASLRANFGYFGGGLKVISYDGMSLIDVAEEIYNLWQTVQNL